MSLSPFEYVGKHLGVHQRKDIHQRIQDFVDQLLPFCHLPHACDEGALIAPITKHQEVRVAGDFRHKLLENVSLLVLVVSPEGGLGLRTICHSDHANKVDEPRVRITLNIQVDLHGTGRELRRPEDIDALVADG